MQVALVLAQMEDGIGHELARPVQGHVAPAFDGNDGNAPRVENVARLGRAPERDDLGVLDQDQRVGNRTGLARGHEVPLHAQHLAVLAQAQVEDDGVLWRGANLPGALRWGRSD